MNLKRSGSLGSLNFELEITQSGEGPMSKSSSENDISFLLAVDVRSPSGPCAKKMCRCPSSCASLDAILEDEQPDTPSKREIIRLHIATPPRLLLVFIVFLLNLTVGVTAAAASFLSIGGKPNPSQANKVISPVIRTTAACRTAKRGTPTRCPPRVFSPKLQLPAALANPAALWPGEAMPNIPLDELKTRAAERVAELTRAVQDRASSDLSKLLAQLSPAEESHPDHHAVPAAPVAWVAFLSTAAAVLATPEERLTTLSEAEAQRKALEEAARLVEESNAAAAATSFAQGFGSRTSVLLPTVTLELPPSASSPSSSSSSASRSRHPALPSDFDLDIAIRTGELCGHCYHSCDPRDKQGNPTHRHRLESDLTASRYTLIAEVESTEYDTYALIVRRGAEVFVVFRGSATLKNLQVDLAYQPATKKKMAKFAEEIGLRLPSGLSVHGGFLDAWRSLRVGVLAELEKIVRDEQGPLKLIVGGHSMGGAMAMFASLELAARLRKQPGGNPFTLGHVTYTFAAPRLGNDKFARLYNRMFPKRSDHWALQRSNDAVPHLPFHAWGFRHPKGVAFLEVEDTDEGCDPLDGCEIIEQGELAPPRGTEKPLDAVREIGDRGDDYRKLRPYSNKVENWANYHHIAAYLEPLQGLVGKASPRLAGYEGFEA